jgi:hypothetical protein
MNLSEVYPTRMDRSEDCHLAATVVISNERRFSEDSIRQSMGRKKCELRWYSIHPIQNNITKRTSKHRNRRECVLTA